MAHCDARQGKHGVGWNSTDGRDSGVDGDAICADRTGGALDLNAFAALVQAGRIWGAAARARAMWCRAGRAHSGLDVIRHPATRG